MHTIKQFMLEIKALIAQSLLGVAAFSNLDATVRTLSAIVGLVFFIPTGYKLVLSIVVKRQERKLNDIRLKREEEEFRRFMETKYKDK